MRRRVQLRSAAGKGPVGNLTAVEEGEKECREGVLWVELEGTSEQLGGSRGLTARPEHPGFDYVDRRMPLAWCERAKLGAALAREGESSEVWAVSTLTEHSSSKR